MKSRSIVKHRSQVWMTESLQGGNLAAKKRNICLFLRSASQYGVPDKYLFKPEDLAVQAHFYKWGVWYILYLFPYIFCIYFIYFAPEWPGRCSRLPSWPTRTLSTGGRSLTSTGSLRTSWTRFVKMEEWRIEYDGWSLCFRDIIIYCCNKEVICLRENSLKNINTTASGDSAKIQHSRHIRHANKHQFHLCQSDAGECWSLEIESHIFDLFLQKWVVHINIAGCGEKELHYAKGAALEYLCLWLVS